MSSRKVKTIKVILPYTATSAVLNTLVCVTTVAHLLVTGDLVSVLASSGVQDYVSVAVTVIDAYTFSITVSGSLYSTSGYVHIPFFRTGIVGRQLFPSNHITGTPAVVQSYVSGTGGASYTIDQSLDGIHWTPSGITVSHSTTDQDTQGNLVSGDWAYLAINVSVVGAATSLNVMYSA